MTVNITWSLSDGGTAISSAISHGNVGNGVTTTAQELYVRHDGANEITNVGLYIRQFSGEYLGDFTAAADIAEILSWGDSNTLNGFGGAHVNFNATTSYATGWPTYLDKSPTGGYACRSGVGDSEANALQLPTTTGAVTAGEIPAGSTPGVRFKLRFQVPTDEDTVGIRYLETVLRYTYTS